MRKRRVDAFENPRPSVLVCAGVLLAAVVSGQGRIRVMLLDGQNNHDWRATTPVLKKMLDETGLFDTTIVTAPEIASPAFASFNPDFSHIASS